MAVSVLTLVQILLLLVTVELAAMAAMAWQRRKRVPESRVVLLLLLAVGFYAGGYAGELGAKDVAGAVFWLQIQYLGIPWMAALLLLLAREHNHLQSKVWHFLLPSLVIFVAQLTNGWHGLYRSHMEMVARPPFTILHYQRGPVAWFNLIYLYGALVYSAWIYLRRLRGSSRLYRKQSLFFVASSLPPMVGYLLFMADKSPWGLDLAPLMMSVSALLGYFAVIHYEFFDMVPMAHSLVFASMRDAVLVTDLEFRLVDLNEAARDLLPELSGEDLGRNVAQRLGQSPSLRPIFDEPGCSHEIELSVGAGKHQYEVRMLPLRREEVQQGWAVIWADKTAQVHLLHELRRDAETDDLTGIANRRAFVAAAEEAEARNREHAHVYSLLLVDVDHFKQINDRQGHAGGDTVLKVVTATLSRCLRQSDLLSRYGGDEFAVLLAGIGMPEAAEVAERMRSAVAGLEEMVVTLSIGLAVSDVKDGSWESTIERADRALYRAKSEGRNRVCAWSESVAETGRHGKFSRAQGRGSVSLKA